MLLFISAIIILALILIIVYIGINITDSENEKLKQKESELDFLNDKLKEEGFSESERQKRLNYAKNNYSTNSDGTINNTLLLLMLAQTFNEDSSDTQQYEDSISISHDHDSSNDSSSSFDSGSSDSGSSDSGSSGSDSGGGGGDSSF